MIDVSQEGKELVVRWLSAAKGLDSKSSPLSAREGYVPDLQNVDLSGLSQIDRVDGATLHTAGDTQGTIDSLGAVTIDSLGAIEIDDLGVTKSTVGIVYPGSVESTLFAQYRSSRGVEEYLVGGRDQHVRKWDSTTGTFISLRRDFSQSNLTTDIPTWWSWTRLADYLIVSNLVNGTFKYDGSRLLPLGAKHIADFESNETWAGDGAITTSFVKQGVQGRLFTSTGAAVTGTRTPSTALDLTDGLLEARDYTTADLIHFWVNIDIVANLDTANTFIRFGNSADTAFFQLTAANWVSTSLVAGWNEISVLKSAFAITGAPNWNNIAKVTLQVDSVGASTVNVAFDDLYLRYAVAFPGAQVLNNYRNIVWGGQTMVDPSSIHFTKASAPDDYDNSASFLIDENDGFPVTGIGTLYNQLVPFKGHSVHSLTVDSSGKVYPAYDINITRVTREHGCSSHRSIVEVGNRLYYWFEGNIYAYNGLTLQKLSYWVEPALASIDEEEHFRVTGGLEHDKNQISWWYPGANSGQNSRAIRYDYALEAFLPTVGQTVALVLEAHEADTHLLLTIGYTGRVLLQNSGASFDGTAITAYVTSPWLSAKRPESIKTWLEAFVNYQTNTGNLILEYRIAKHPRGFDAATFTTAATIDMSVTGEFGRLFIGEQDKWIQLRLRTVGADFSIYMPVTILATDEKRHA